MTVAALAAALLELAGHPSDRALRARVRVMAPVILDASARPNPPIDPVLVGAIAFSESLFDQTAVGRAGELGAWQVKPDGRAMYVCGRLLPRLGTSVRANAACAVRILAWARARCGGEPENWVGLYNGRRRCGSSRYARRLLAVMGKGAN